MQAICKHIDFYRLSHTGLAERKKMLAVRLYCWEHRLTMCNSIRKEIWENAEKSPLKSWWRVRSPLLCIYVIVHFGRPRTRSGIA